MTTNRSHNSTSEYDKIHNEKMRQKTETINSLNDELKKLEGQNKEDVSFENVDTSTQEEENAYSEIDSPKCLIDNSGQEYKNINNLLEENDDIDSNGSKLIY
jgi:hypothetical protein